MDQTIETARPPEQISHSSPPPKGRERFSTHTFLENLRSAAEDRKFMLKLFGSIALWATVTNPLNTPDPTPFWQNLLYGTKAEAAETANIDSSLDRKYPEIVKIAPPLIKSKVIPPHLETFAKDPERIQNTLRWKSLIEQVVADKRLNIKPEERQGWVNHMLKIIFIESAGDPQASSGIAFGLTQLKASTADEIAKQYQISKYDIYKNAWDNAFLGTAYQLNLAKWYGPQLSVWTHHLGMGNMNIALRTYLVSNLKLPISTVEDLFNDSNKLSQTINQHNITPQVLLSSPAVTAQLKSIGAWGNLTWEYYSRYLAAGISLQVLG